MGGAEGAVRRVVPGMTFEEQTSADPGMVFQAEQRRYKKIGTVLLRYRKPVWLKRRGSRVYLCRIQSIKPELRVMGRHWRVLSGSDTT